MKTIETWFLWLMIYSMIGWIYESTICSIGHRKLINRGFLNGPYCPIYGTGAVLVLLVLGKIQNPVALFFAGAVVTCSLEYFTSWLMEKLFHARWWDYSKRKFNIGGRVCLIGAVVFGAFSVVLIKFLHPLIKGLTDRLTDTALAWVSALLFLGIVSDFVVTVKGLLGTHAVFAEYAVLLQQKRKELADRLREAGYEGRERLREASEEGREKLRLGAEEGREKLREAETLGAEERERIRRVTEEERERFYAKLQMRLNAQQRRTINSFPHLQLTRNNEVLDGLRQAMEQAKQRRKDSKTKKAS